ncbi:MAG: amino acid permease [Paraglaciecola sp.]|jgi:amino acid permease
MTAEKLNDLGRITAFVSFMIGTGILGYCFSNTPGGEIIIFGLLYLLFAAFVNSIILMLVISKAATDAPNREELAYTALLMLLNIPIAFFYCCIIF